LLARRRPPNYAEDQDPNVMRLYLVSTSEAANEILAALAPVRK
jgi:hypothetical protein